MGNEFILKDVEFLKEVWEKEEKKKWPAQSWFWPVLLAESGVWYDPANEWTGSGGIERIKEIYRCSCGSSHLGTILMVSKDKIIKKLNH